MPVLMLDTRFPGIGEYPGPTTNTPFGRGVAIAEVREDPNQNRGEEDRPETDSKVFQPLHTSSEWPSRSR